MLGCTVTPKRAVDNVASFDGGKQNSGVLGYYTNSVGEQFLILSPNARARYNALIASYGGTNYFLPPLAPDDGIAPFTNGTFTIDARHEVDFRLMNGWRKNVSQ